MVYRSPVAIFAVVIKAETKFRFRIRSEEFGATNLVKGSRRDVGKLVQKNLILLSIAEEKNIAG